MPSHVASELFFPVIGVSKKYPFQSVTSIWKINIIIINEWFCSRPNSMVIDFNSVDRNKFVCLGLTSLLNIWGHVATVPACSSGTLTDVLLHMNDMPQTQDMTFHPVTVYKHRADLSLCYQLMSNVILEYTSTHFNVLGNPRPGNLSPTSHTHQRTLNIMILIWW